MYYKLYLQKVKLYRHTCIHTVYNQIILLPVFSFMSAITLLGTPSEVYQFGFIYWLIGFSYILVMPAAAYLYFPVFYKLQVRRRKDGGWVGRKEGGRDEVLYGMEECVCVCVREGEGCSLGDALWIYTHTHTHTHTHTGNASQLHSK